MPRRRSKSDLEKLRGGPAKQVTIATINARLRRGMKEFMERANLSDKQFLTATFDWWQTEGLDGDSGPILGLACAFEEAITESWEVLIVEKAKFRAMEVRLFELEKFAAKVKVLPKPSAA